jgi:predicted acetyltransferase
MSNIRSAVAGRQRNMAAEIRKLNIRELKIFSEIAINAYPGFKIETEKQRQEFIKRQIRLQREEPSITAYGLFRNGRLLGGIRLLDFEMTLFSVQTMIGGGGLLAVDLLHKKEKAARDLMHFFVNHFRQRGACLTALYPFRPDFYRKMGFGYGTKGNLYKIRPVDLPARGRKENVRFLAKRDFRALTQCYNRYALRTHGMIKKLALELERLAGPNVRIIGYYEGNVLRGYLAFTLKLPREGNFIRQDLHIIELIYESREAYLGLISFLQSQADQVNRIVYGTQDDSFHFLPVDPRNDADDLIGPLGHETNSQGVGIMYRVINNGLIFRLLRNHSFNDQNCRLRLNIADNFLTENSGSLVVHFIEGRPHLKKGKDFDVEISLDISDFSSLIMGAVSFIRLYDYGLADVSDTGFLSLVDKIFRVPEKPRCTTLF